jgi:maleylpyruvate isomerase
MADTVLGPGDHSTNQTSAGAAHLADQAAVTLAAIERATDRLMTVVDDLDDMSMRGPSLLPGWRRSHVLSHLARNADGCLNLLIWARTGVEHAMYASRADRDAAIEEGARRSHQLLVEDLNASCARFAAAAHALPARAWGAEVVGGPGEKIPAHEVLRSRLLEVWVHLADLDGGFGFDDIPEPDVEHVLEDVVQQFGGRADVPALSVVVDFDEGRLRTWELRGTTTRPQQVRGRPGAMLGWLLGRTGSERLEGEAPELPAWL